MTIEFVLTMEMSMHIDNQPWLHISSKVKNSDVYSHEMSW